MTATPQTLVNVNNTNGPASSLIADNKGDLFGTTEVGGDGFGTVGSSFDTGPHLF
jgi:hypothetical protein